MKLTVAHTILRLKTHPRPLFIMTCGLPCSGKSTFLNQLAVNPEFADLVVASTDGIIEAEAAKRGITYDEAFKVLNFKHVNTQFKEDIAAAVAFGKLLAVDQTNGSAKHRRSTLSLIPSEYIKVCVSFDIPAAVTKARMAARFAATGKSVPDFIVANMARSWVTPHKSEGFHDIIEIIQ